MLGDISGLEKIYIVCGYTDMRKSIDGLCAIIEDQLKMDPTSSALFLFCGRRRDRIKALFHEPDGFVLIYKRLSVRGGYQWPRKQSEVRNLSWREFDWLMSGIEYSCAVTPQVRQTGNRLSGLAGTAYASLLT